MKKYKISIFARTYPIIMYAQNKKKLEAELYTYLSIDKSKIVKIEEVTK